jgi:hypothetical protein
MQVQSQQNFEPVGTPPYTQCETLDYLGRKIPTDETRLLRPNAKRVGVVR